MNDHESYMKDFAQLLVSTANNVETGELLREHEHLVAAITKKCREHMMHAAKRNLFNSYLFVYLLDKECDSSHTYKIHELIDPPDDLRKILSSIGCVSVLEAVQKILHPIEIKHCLYQIHADELSNVIAEPAAIEILNRLDNGTYAGAIIASWDHLNTTKPQ